MKSPKHRLGSPVFLWSAVAFVALSIGLFTVSAPESFAQTAPSTNDDPKRYSQLLQSIYQFVLQNYVDNVDPKKLYEGAMKGMFDSLGDPHSTFLDSAMLSDLMTETDGKYAGIGLYISKQPGTSSDTEPKYVEVVSPIEDTPAWKEGIRPGDLIIKIDGVDTSKMAVDEASAKIRGDAGTKVKLTFRRGTYDFDIEFTRASIEIPAIKSDVIKKNGAIIGYIRIIDWVPQTAQKVKDALVSFEKQGMTDLIVDVRSNPGGLLNSVVDVSDLFVSSGVIVSTKGRNPQENSEFKATGAIAVPTSLRMVVLVNKGSASASEIFSGAMKDTHRALLLGERTYGKGSVQQIFPLDTTGFKLTMARYFTPSGVNIDKKGIEPDIVSPELTLTDAQMKTLQKLYDSGKIAIFLKSNPEPNMEQRDAFAFSLNKDGFDLPDIVLRKVVKDEADRTKPAPVYDLEFDTQLNEAIAVITSPGFETKLAAAHTLSESMQPAQELIKK
jgi:carboxyl-terminal processing protease